MKKSIKKEIIYIIFFILTNMLEIYILELPKFNRYKEKETSSELNLWINFIKKLI